jgi:glycosyltransferase involved in cell wall biosynthesis
MHLIYLHQYFAFPTIHGSTRSYDLAAEFVKKGIKVTVITTTAKVKGLNESKRWNYLEKEDINLWVLTSNYSQNLSFIKRGILFLTFMLYASQKILENKCDIVLASSTPITVVVPALLKRIFSGTPFVFEVRDVWPDVPVKMGILKNKWIIGLLYWFERLAYKKASHIVALSVGMKKSIAMRFKNNKTTVITNISEIKRFNSYSFGDKINLDFNIGNAKIVLYAGALGRVNGIKYVSELATATILLDPEIIYLIIGAGNEKESVISFCKEKNILNKNIFFLDPVPKNSLPYFYSTCTVGSSFVIDNEVLWDNSANKFFDTLAAGKPILINYRGWQADLIEKENIGYILPPSLTANSITTFIEYIINKELILLQGKNALNVAKREFSLERSVELYLEVFGKVLNSD